MKVGDPLYRLVSNRILKAHLPYPESAAARIRPGQPVRLTSAQAPGRVIEGTVEQVKPTVSETSRAIDVQVSRLRKLIEPDPATPRYLQTVWGFGYVFIPDGESK